MAATHGVSVRPVSTIWLDGKMVPWAEAKVHVLTHTLHYGLGAFEGIRCYQRADGRSAVFRLPEHVERLLATSHVMTVDVPWRREEIVEACLDVLRTNGMAAGYVRPLVFLGDGGLGLGSLDNPTRLAIAAFAWGAYLGDDSVQQGARLKVSSFTRGGLNSAMTKVKIVGQYVNSVLAKREVMRAGYDEALLLDDHGWVAEASGENVFMCRGGRLITPSLSSPILPGLTRDTVITLAREAGMTVEERGFSRDELYLAEEVFLTGTAAEITPVREIDDRRIGQGKPGPITLRLQAEFLATVRGPDARHPEWLTFL